MKDLSDCSVAGVFLRTSPTLSTRTEGNDGTAVQRLRQKMSRPLSSGPLIHSGVGTDFTVFPAQPLLLIDSVGEG